MTTSQYTHAADWYDRIYAGSGKNWAAEADRVNEIVRRHAPAAASLLDVGCGTGLHLVRFADLYSDVAGIDLDPVFVACARARGCEVSVGDMRTLDLGRTYDVVTSLYSSIGHMADRDELDMAVAAMACHVAPGGVLVFEPWVLPDAWEDGAFGVQVSDAPDSILTRANRGWSEDGVSVLDFAWTHVDASGIRRVEEQLRLTLFDAGSYRAAIERAGLVARFDVAGCNEDGRGLWIGTRSS